MFITPLHISSMYIYVKESTMFRMLAKSNKLANSCGCWVVLIHSPPLLAIGEQYPLLVIKDSEFGQVYDAMGNLDRS